MNRLIILDKTTKRVIGVHEYWEDNFTLENDWKTYDAAKHRALILDKSINLKDPQGNFIQPKNWDGADNEIEYIAEDQLPPLE